MLILHMKKMKHKILKWEFQLRYLATIKWDVKQLTIEYFQNKAKTQLGKWFPLRSIVRIWFKDVYLWRVVWGFFRFLTLFLSCNLHTKQFTHLECTIQWSLIYSQNCAIATIYFMFLSLQKKNLTCFSPHLSTLPCLPFKS